MSESLILAFERPSHGNPVPYILEDGFMES